MASTTDGVLKEYLKELCSGKAADSKDCFMLQKCIRVIGNAKSSLDPAALAHLNGFGPYILRRVVGHFSKPENRVELCSNDDLEGGELHGQVRQALRDGVAGDLSLGKFTRKVFQDVLNGLAVFRPLRDSRDLGLLRSCKAKPQLLQALQTRFPPRRAAPKAKAANVPRRRKAPAGTGAGGETPAVASQVPSRGLSQRVVSAARPLKAQRGHKKHSGPWAVMVALYMTGKPQTKDQLDRLSAEHRLCSEPLVRKQRTVAHGSQWYDPWSGVNKQLIKKRWVARSKGRYSLTEAGMEEARRYHEQHQAQAPPSEEHEEPSAGGLKRLFSQMSQASDVSCASTGCETASASQASKSSEWSQERTAAATSGHGSSDDDEDDDFCLVRASSSQSLAPLWSGLKSRTPSSQSGGPGAATATAPRQKRPRWAKGALAPPTVHLDVLVDVTEKPVIRQRLAQQLAASPPVELAVPGVDYAFGRLAEGRWALGEVLLERKTVFDYLDTLDSARGVLQSNIHKTLREQSFRVAVIIEGVNALARHPREQELLTAAHAPGGPEVIVTASVDDTAEFIAAVAEAGREHDGWSLEALGVLLKAHYEPNPQQLCENALVLLGAPRRVAASAAGAFRDLATLLGEAVPGPDCDAEVVVHALAAAADLTLLQAGRLLHTLGVSDAPLLRHRRRARRGSQETEEDDFDEAADTAEGDEGVTLEIGTGFSTAFLRSLKTSFKVVTDASLGRATVRVRLGDRSRVFHITDGSAPLPWTPGRHHLLVGTDGTQSWAQLTKKRARAFAEQGIASSLCTSLDQASRHVAACAKALEAASERPSPRAASHRGLVVQKGLAGVLALSRTAAGTLPEDVARAVAGQLDARQADPGGLAALVRQLRVRGDAFLLDLAVPNFGRERAAAVRALLLGS